MGKIYNNAVTTTAGFKYDSNSPLDDRVAVGTRNDLTNLAKYEGMIVYIKDEDRYYKYTKDEWDIFSDVGRRTDEGGEIFNDYVNNQATTPYSHASGKDTIASAEAQTVVGKFNQKDDDALFIVGNGTWSADSTRNNAFVVKNDGTVMANEKELSTKEYVDGKIAKSNKSLVFNTKENLEGFINGTTNLYCLETCTNVYTPEDWSEFYGGIAGGGGIQGYNLPEGIYTVKVEANGSYSEMSLFDYIISNNSDGTITYSIPAGGAKGNWVWWQRYDQNETITLTMTVQIVKGNSIKIKTEYFEREDGITKENLNTGDLLLVEEENVPDYYWDGNKIIELEISLPENIVTKEELSNKISLWQPNTEYKVGDVVIANLKEVLAFEDNLYSPDYPYRTVIAKCVRQHTSINFFDLNNNTFETAWEILQETYAYYDALGRGIHNTYATKEEVPTNLQDGTNDKSLYQESEKDDTALPLSFTEIHSDVKGQIADTYNKVEDTGENATSLGTSIAKGKRSFAGGSSNLSTGKASATIGADNYNAGHNTAMFGYANTTTLKKDNSGNPLGSYGLVGGSKHILRDNNQTVGGHGNDVSGHCASAFGDGLIVKGHGQTVIGKFNQEIQDALFIIGNGTNEAKSNAFVVRPDGGLVIGNGAGETITFTFADLKALKALITK